MKKLIRYSQTPQVTALEYEELRDLEEHPEKAEKYADLVARRTRGDRLEVKK